MTNLSSAGIKKIILRYAIISTLLYIAYFAFIKLIGLPYSEWIYINFIVYCVTAWYSLKAAGKVSGNQFGYLQGVLIAYMVGALSFIFFAFFVLVYSYFGSFFNSMVLHKFSYINRMGRLTVPFILATEGVVLCSVLSLCIIQLYRIYYKRKRVVDIN